MPVRLIYALPLPRLCYSQSPKETRCHFHFLTNIYFYVFDIYLTIVAKII